MIAVLCDDPARDTNGWIDASHCPARKAIEILPVFAEDELAKAFEESRRKECRTLFAIAVELCEEFIRKARRGGELSHHLREEDGVGRHGCFRNHVGGISSATD